MGAAARAACGIKSSRSLLDCWISGCRPGRTSEGQGSSIFVPVAADIDQLGEEKNRKVIEDDTCNNGHNRNSSRRHIDAPLCPFGPIVGERHDRKETGDE